MNYKQFRDTHEIYVRLLDFPEQIKECQSHLLDGNRWCSLVIDHPQLAEHCQWHKFSIYDWDTFNRFEPQFKYRKVGTEITNLPNVPNIEFIHTTSYRGKYEQ